MDDKGTNSWPEEERREAQESLRCSPCWNRRPWQPERDVCLQLRAPHSRTRLGETRMGLLVNSTPHCCVICHRRPVWRLCSAGACCFTLHVKDIMLGALHCSSAWELSNYPPPQMSALGDIELHSTLGTAATRLLCLSTRSRLIGAARAGRYLAQVRWRVDVKGGRPQIDAASCGGGDTCVTGGDVHEQQGAVVAEQRAVCPAHLNDLKQRTGGKSFAKGTLTYQTREATAHLIFCF